MARKGKVTVEDSIVQAYQTAKWGKEAVIELSVSDYAEGIRQVDVRLLDANGVPCLDSKKYVRFTLAGTGKLIANQGTSSGSSLVQACNGTARIRVRTNGSESVVAVSSDGLKTAFINVR